MKLFNVVCALLFGLWAPHVDALVIYTWHDMSPNPDVGPIKASIGFDESIWSFGGKFTFNSSSVYPLPFFGVAEIDFATPLNLDTRPAVNQGFTDPIQLSTAKCGQSAPYGLSPDHYCATRGLAVDDRVVSAGYWDFDLTFGEFLMGSMYLNDFSTDVGMISQDQLFTITTLNSDSPGPCFHPAHCVGSTGYWKRLQVAEPGTALLLMLGLVLLAIAQWLRATRRRVTSA